MAITNSCRTQIDDFAQKMEYKERCCISHSTIIKPKSISLPESQTQDVSYNAWSVATY